MKQIGRESTSYVYSVNRETQEMGVSKDGEKFVFLFFYL